MFRLNGILYDFRTNSNISLEERTNVEAEIDDRVFALVSELHRCWEVLSEIQVPEIHYFTCFLLWIIPHLLHKALYFEKTPLTNTVQELTEKTMQPHPKEDCHPRGQRVHRDSRSKLKSIFQFNWIFRCPERKLYKAKYSSEARLKRGCLPLRLGKGNGGKELLKRFRN